MVLVGVLIAGGLGGCASDGGSSEGASAPRPAPSPTPEATASPAPKHVVVAPERPAALADAGPAGAEAAAVYFVQLDAYMQATGDTAEWEAMSHGTCKYCNRRLDQARRIQERGHTWTGGHATVKILHTHAQDQVTGIWPVDVQYTEDAVRVTDTEGTVLLEAGKTTVQSRAGVARQDGKWKFVTLARLGED